MSDDGRHPTKPRPTSPAGARAKRPTYDQPEHRAMRDGFLRIVRSEPRRPSHGFYDLAQKRVDPFKAAPKRIADCATRDIPRDVVKAEGRTAWDAVVDAIYDKAA